MIVPTGYFSFACEARLALGELGIHVGSSAGRSGLEALARDAHARGFELISRRATSLLDRTGASDLVKYEAKH